MVIALGVRMKGEGPQGQRGGERYREGASEQAGGKEGERHRAGERETQRERDPGIQHCRGQYGEEATHTGSDYERTQHTHNCCTFCFIASQ